MTLDHAAEYAATVARITGKDTGAGFRVLGGRRVYSFTCVVGGYGSTMAEAVFEWREKIRVQLYMQDRGLGFGTVFGRCYGEINAAKFSAALDAQRGAQVREVV